MLREAGVVDAGGYGLTVLFAGVIAALRGSEPPELAHHRAARVTHPQHESSTYRYCTNFAVTGSGLEPRGVRRRRWSGSATRCSSSATTTTLKVHVHTDDPDAATALFAERRRRSRTSTSPTCTRRSRSAPSASPRRRRRRLPPHGRLRRARGRLRRRASAALYESFGVHTLDGGATLNPSTYELLAGIHAVPAEEVVVLPNSPNVFMAAERAAELSEKHGPRRAARARSRRGWRRRSRSTPTRDGAANAAAMSDALERVRTGAVAPAARDDAGGRFRAGEAVGFVDDELVAWGEPEETLRAVARHARRRRRARHLPRRRRRPARRRRDRRRSAPAVELELHDGGQPACWWLLSAE